MSDTYFGFDVGAKRLGVAVGNTVTASANALAVIPVREELPAWEPLDRLCAEWRPSELIVGLPLTLDGGEQPASRRARQLAKTLQQRYALPVHLIDERHSSQEAAARFARARAAGLQRRRHAEALDAQAAAIILERWLQAQPAPPSC